MGETKVGKLEKDTGRAVHTIKMAINGEEMAVFLILGTMLPSN